MKLKESETLNRVLANQHMVEMQMAGGKDDYRSYLNKTRSITSKVSMQSRFMNRDQLYAADNNNRVKVSGGMNAARRSSVLPSLNTFSMGAKPKRQGLNLGASTQMGQMMGASGIQASAVVQKELEEDLKPDYRAEAIDDLDQLAEDLEFSSEEEKDD